MRSKYNKYSMSELYDIYKAQYEKSARVQERNGREPNMSMASYREFLAQFEGDRRDYKELGKNFSVKQVAQMMAKDDVSYVTIAESSARSLAIAKYRFDIGEIKAGDIERESRKIERALRQGREVAHSTEFWNAVRSFRESAKASGKNGNEIAVLVGQEFFGSK